MKSTATYLLILLWPILLCFFVFSGIHTAAEADKLLRASTGIEILLPGQHELPIAWLEQSTEHSTAADFHKVPVVPLPGSRQAHPTDFKYKARLVKPGRSFVSLSTRFRILPNAP